MKNFIFHIVLVFILVVIPGACTKETQSSTGNPNPSIALVKMEPATIQQFTDSLKITISYDDGDGDIGFEDADINSLEIKDTRLSKPDFYYVPPQAPLGSKIHIKGELVIKLRNLFLLGTGNAESTNMEIRLRDRTGNWSNKITTPEITITK
ncbi:MAG: hypothetical protein KG003_03205 [Bacteroidetes bacterium]|nr:hypothetical protein [Bacteroidota bacterium]